jgi:hypothetical protein
MWTKCVVVLDQPVKKLGLEWLDAVVLGATSLALLFFATASIWASGTAALAWAIRRGKHGQPSGAIVHWLHHMCGGLVPGLLPPHAQRYSPWGKG